MRVSFLHANSWATQRTGGLTVTRSVLRSSPTSSPARTAAADDTALSLGTGLTSPDRAHVVLKEQYFPDAVGIITMQIRSTVSNNSPFTTRRKGANSQFWGGALPPSFYILTDGGDVSTAAHVSRCVVLRA